MIPLPQCRWRGPDTQPGRVACSSVKLIKPAHGVPAEFCLRCPYVDHAPEYGIIAQPPQRGQCHELGEPLPGQQTTSCGAKKRRCVIHGVCTTLAVCDGLPCCRTCPDHTDLEKP